MHIGTDGVITKQKSAFGTSKWAHLQLHYSFASNYILR
jgi:hypothetical protein